MESRIALALAMEHAPSALLWSDERPADAVSLKEGVWGCVMTLLGAVLEGKTAAFDRRTYGCIGGGVGLGFGDLYREFPGGVDAFCRFLSTGGERYLKSPEVVRSFVDLAPVADIPAKYVLMKRLASIDPAVEEPRVVFFLADPRRIAALVVLANHARMSNESVIIPFAAGCQSIGIFPYREGRSETPRGVVGLVDLTARLKLKARFGDNLFTFAVPYGMFLEMEGNVAGSFLERDTWKKLAEDN